MLARSHNPVSQQHREDCRLLHKDDSRRYPDIWIHAATANTLLDA